MVNPNPKPHLTVLTPAFNEAKNLPVLHKKLVETLSAMGVDWEWIIVDDHSSDATSAVSEELAKHEPNVRAFRLSRNSGSHRAIACGIDHARGDCAVVMAADLQDPPETLPELYAEWKKGAQVVWAVRAERQGESTATLGFSRLYYYMMRKYCGMPEMPATGADFFLIDRAVIEAFKKFSESNMSVLALITWMGFRQTGISYTKQARLHGSSGWSFAKKIKLAIDSLTSFSFFPIRAMTYCGFGTAAASLLYASVIVLRVFNGHRPEGWSSLMVVMLFLGGMQMSMLGVLGEYLWRALEESRRRPRYLIEWSSEASHAKDEPWQRKQSLTAAGS